MKKNVTVLCLVLTLGLCGCSESSVQAGSGVPDTPINRKISAEEAYQMMKKSKNYILLDVRTDEEFRGKRIDGAILVPDYELEKRAVTELPDKNAAIFVYCRSGKRSANAAKILAEKGYTQIFDFGGIADWPYETVSGNQ